MDEEVVAFVDESFHSFFNLSEDTGYFCMGVFLIPTKVMWEFENIFLGYRKNLAGLLEIQDTGKVSDELKSTKLRSIPKAKRIELLDPLLKWAQANDIAIGGFYTTTKGYVNYNVRNDAATMQSNIQSLLDPEKIRLAREDILHRRKSSHAESMMIGDIALVIAGMLLHYCGQRGMKFTLNYDPRGEEEDRKVFERIDSLLKPLEKIILGRSGVYIGCDNSKSSRDSCGLQMVDYLTRDLRTLFQDRPELLSQGASKELVTAEICDPDNTIPTSIGNRIFKWGETRPMEKSLPKDIFSPQARFSIGDYHSILMAQRLSCYSETGEARVINLKEFTFENMVD